MNYANSRYFFILSFLASYSPHNWDATNYKSHQSSRFVTKSSLASHRLSSTASYSTSLSEATNANLTTCAIDKPFGDCRIIPAPPPTTLDESSISRSHEGSQRSCGHTSDIVAIKSARILPLIVDLGRYSMSNSFNSTAD